MNIQFGETHSLVAPHSSPPKVFYTPTKEGIEALKRLNADIPRSPWKMANQIADQFEKINWKKQAPNDYFDKVAREMNELFYEVAQPQPNKEKMTMEAGDVAISLLRIFKHYNISPEESLVRSSEKYALRLQKMMNDSDKSIDELSQVDRCIRRKLWKDAKLVYA